MARKCSSVTCLLKLVSREVVSQREELGKRSHRMDVDQQNLMDSVDKEKLSKDPQVALDVKKAMVKFQVDSAMLFRLYTIISHTTFPIHFEF